MFKRRQMYTQQLDVIFGGSFGSAFYQNEVVFIALCVRIVFSCSPPAAEYALLSVLFIMNTFYKLPQQKGLLFMHSDLATEDIFFMYSKTGRTAGL